MSTDDTNLVLDEKLDTLDGSSSSLRDGGGNTTHCRETVSIQFIGCMYVASVDGESCLIAMCG